MKKKAKLKKIYGGGEGDDKSKYILKILKKMDILYNIWPQNQTLRFSWLCEAAYKVLLHKHNAQDT